VTVRVQSVVVLSVVVPAVVLSDAGVSDAGVSGVMVCLGRRVRGRGVRSCPAASDHLFGVTNSYPLFRRLSAACVRIGAA
jgi:hypothetical protein